MPSSDRSGLSGWTLAIGLGLASTVSMGAQADPAISFEAASVRRTAPDTRGSSIDKPGGAGFNARGTTLKELITTAYHVQELQITGGPAWIGSERYDVTAKAGAPVTPAQTRRMLQTLLAERFQLAVHRSTKELPYYSLTPAKSGPKLNKSDLTDCPGTPAPDPACGGFRVYMRREVTGFAVTMDETAEVLSWLTAHVVEDKTALNGRYDFKLTFTPDESLGPLSSERPDAPRDDANAPSLFTALQEQLGLRLEARKGPVPALVIDRAEKASEN